MWPLLLKDLRIQKRFIWIGFAFIAVFFFALGAFEGIPLAVPAALYSHFLIVIASKSDEKNNNGLMLASLPVRRRDLVAAKYGGLFMFWTLAFGSAALLRTAGGYLFPPGELPWYDARSTMLVLAALALFYAVYFPLFFAFGSRLAQFLDLIVIFAIGGLGVLFLRVSELLGYDGSASILHAMANDADMFALKAVGACLILLLLSWRVSVFAYERRAL